MIACLLQKYKYICFYASILNRRSTDSDIVAPYEKWAYYDAHVKEIDQQRNYASNKTKKVAWFVSNCRTPNHRLEYAKELANYIQVSEIMTRRKHIDIDNPSLT